MFVKLVISSAPSQPCLYAHFSSQTSEPLVEVMSSAIIKATNDVHHLVMQCVYARSNDSTTEIKNPQFYS